MQGVSYTTMRRRRHKSLEGLSKGKENVDLLLMRASQVYSATSHWQAQVDAAEAARQAAVSMLEDVSHKLQVAKPQTECKQQSACLFVLCSSTKPCTM